MNWAAELNKDTEPTTIVIGYTKIGDTNDYLSMIDGYRPGAEQHVISVEVDLPVGLDPYRIAELCFYATNAPEIDKDSSEQRIRDAIVDTGYTGREAHWSISVGDTVRVGDVLLACESVSWTRVGE